MRLYMYNLYGYMKKHGKLLKVCVARPVSPLLVFANLHVIAAVQANASCVGTRLDLWIGPLLLCPLGIEFSCNEQAHLQVVPHS